MAGHDSRMPKEGVSSFAHSLTPDKATKTPTKVVLWSRLCHDHHFLLPRLLSGRSVTTKTRTTTAARSHSAFSSIPGVAFPRVKVHVLYDAQLINHDTDGRTERRPGSKKRIIDSWIEYRPVESANSSLPASIRQVWWNHLQFPISDFLDPLSSPDCIYFRYRSIPHRLYSLLFTGYMY